MMLCDILNNTEIFAGPNFQEYFFYEPLLFRDMTNGCNESTILLEEDMFWLKDSPSLYSRDNRRIQATILYRPSNEVSTLKQTTAYRAYRTMLETIFLERGFPKFAKIHCRHQQLFLDKALIEQGQFDHSFQNRDYIVISRRDKVAQAVSLFFSTMKSQVVVTDSSMAQWHSGTIPYDEKRLMMIYHSLIKTPSFDWTPFLDAIKKHTSARISYIAFEDLVSNPAHIIQNSLEGDLGYTNSWNGIKSGIKKMQIRKSTRAESAEYTERFRVALLKQGPTSV